MTNDQGKQLTQALVDFVLRVSKGADHATSKELEIMPSIADMLLRHPIQLAQCFEEKSPPDY